MKMIMRRGVAAFLVVLLLMMTLFGTVATAEDAEARGVKLYRGTFHYEDETDTFYYGDSYFAASGREENEHLRTFSAAMAFSVLGTTTEDTVDLLTNIGMEPDSIVMEDMVKGTPDTIGTIIAKKELDEMPLIAVVIRGNDYAGEWANNVTVGSEGDATGFASSADKVSGRIQAYLEENGIEQAKIWVCGYSRAGGVANLVGKAMNEDPAAFCTTEDDIYVYTYEAPRCSADDTVYENIYNIYDVNDFFARLSPESWGLHLNGVAVTIGDPDETITGKYFSLSVDGLIKEIGERPKAEFLSQFEEYLGTTIPRETYAALYEPYFSDAIDVCMSKSWDERQKVSEFLTKIGELAKAYPQMKTVILNLLANADPQTSINLISMLLSNFMDEARASVAPPFTDEEYAKLKAAVRPFASFALALIAADRSYSETNDNGTTTYPFYRLITFFANVEDFIAPHYSYAVFEKLKDMDSYYTAGVRITPGDVIIGQNRYTFNEYGWPLEDIVKYAGFSEEDIQIWKNGYELRLENVLTKIDDPGMDLYLAAAGKFDKSMSMYEFYELSMTKTVGFHSYPVDPDETPVKLKDNPICLTIPQEKAKKCVRYGVVRVDDLGINHQYTLDTEIVNKDNGDVELWVNAMRPAVYASAIDDRRWCTSADVDYDDTVTVLDVTHIQRSIANMETFNVIQQSAADVDGDGETTVLDIAWIQRYLAMVSVPYDIGETKEILEKTD